MMWQTNRYFLREGDSMNYMIKGIQALKESFFLGIIIYIVIFVLLYLFKKRRTISWNYMFEGILHLLRYASQPNGDFHTKL